MKTPEEIARELLWETSSCGGELCYVGPCKCRDAIAAALRVEREAREKAEAERDEYLGCWKRTDEHCDRIERETIERCIALIAGMFNRAPEVATEIEARLRAMGDKPTKEGQP